jgi:hypothetical protein
MNESSKKANPDRAPLTVAHGRKLFDQNKEIATLLGKMQPLLTLIEEKGEEPEDDPIAKIVELLATIVVAQQRQDQHQQILGKKLDFVIARLTASAQFSDSDE